MTSMIYNKATMDSSTTRSTPAAGYAIPLARDIPAQTATNGNLEIFFADFGESEEESPLRRRFALLSHEWKDATRFSSSITDVAMHPAYQQIIGMGTDAIPLIVEELRKAPDQWFWALKAITGEDPVDVTDRGRVRRMSDAWLNWAQQNGYG